MLAPIARGPPEPSHEEGKGSPMRWSTEMKSLKPPVGHVSPLLFLNGVSLRDRSDAMLNLSFEFKNFNP